MPRKSKTNLSDENSKDNILKEIYNDVFTVKNTSLRILKGIANEIDYTNKEEVLKYLPMVQKQMEIINKNNDTLLLIQERLNG
jgi:DNA-binding transcriptional regulator GbsR (MarR family)